PMPNAPSPEAVLSRVRALARLFHARTDDPETRRAVSGELKTLRQLWKRNSSLFLPDTLAMLKELARSLDAHATSTGARADPIQVLHQVFGFKEFRPGQLPIIESVLAG